MTHARRESSTTDAGSPWLSVSRPWPPRPGPQGAGPSSFSGWPACCSGLGCPTLTPSQGSAGHCERWLPGQCSSVWTVPRARAHQLGSCPEGWDLSGSCAGPSGELLVWRGEALISMPRPSTPPLFVTSTMVLHWIFVKKR